MAATLLKRYQIPFTIDLQKPTSTDQIWNQPTYGYHVYTYRPVRASEAANLVAHGTTRGPETVYWWSYAARGFAFVELGLHFVGEHGPNLLVVPGNGLDLRAAHGGGDRASTPTRPIREPRSSGVSTSISRPRTPTG